MKVGLLYLILLGMKNVLDKTCRENQNTSYAQYIFSRKLYHLLDNVEKFCRTGQATDDSTIRWITKATSMHSECWIIFALPRQKLLRERASVLRYMYTDTLIVFAFLSMTRL
jgi:hypothetical protein